MFQVVTNFSKTSVAKYEVPMPKVAQIVYYDRVAAPVSKPHTKSRNHAALAFTCTRAHHLRIEACQTEECPEKTKVLAVHHPAHVRCSLCLATPAGASVGIDLMEKEALQRLERVSVIYSASSAPTTCKASFSEGWLQHQGRWRLANAWRLEGRRGIGVHARSGHRVVDSRGAPLRNSLDEQELHVPHSAAAAAALAKMVSAFGTLQQQIHPPSVLFDLLSCIRAASSASRMQL
eukprot:2505105-Amphidinium_carterae.1